MIIVTLFLIRIEWLLSSSRFLSGLSRRTMLFGTIIIQFILAHYSLTVNLFVMFVTGVLKLHYDLNVSMFVVTAVKFVLNFMFMLTGYRLSRLRAILPWNASGLRAC